MTRLEITRGHVEAASAVLIAAATALEARGEPLWQSASLTPERLLRHYPAGSWRVALQDDRPVACLSLHDADPLFWPDDAPGTALYLHKLAVHPDAQGQGLSGWMLDRAAHEVRERGLSALKLDAMTSRPKLRALYETYGFDRVGERRVLDFDVTLYSLHIH